jgi:tubulin monoglycylase TTLL3/8
MRSFPYVTDLLEWKKKNRLEASDKVYIITGGYGDLKKALK